MRVGRTWGARVRHGRSTSEQWWAPSRHGCAAPSTVWMLASGLGVSQATQETGSSSTGSPCARPAGTPVGSAAGGWPRPPSAARPRSGWPGGGPTARPLARRRITRTKWASPAAFLSGHSEPAGDRGRVHVRVAQQPAQRRADEELEGHQRGGGVARAARSRGARPCRPTASGLPGLIATRQKSICHAQPLQRRPHEVALAHRDARAGEHHVVALARLRGARSTSSSVSRAMPSSVGTPARARAPPARARARWCPRCGPAGGSSARHSSSPVERMATRGPARHADREHPLRPAAAPSSGMPRGVPAGSSTSPARASSPGGAHVLAAASRPPGSPPSPSPSRGRRACAPASPPRPLRRAAARRHDPRAASPGPHRSRSAWSPAWIVSDHRQAHRQRAARSALRTA